MNACCWILLWSLANHYAPAPAEPATWREAVVGSAVIPGGIADPAGRNGFIANLEGGFSAIDLRNGKVLWDTKISRVPVALTGERVYASVTSGQHTLRLVGLDATRHGEVVLQSDPVALPESQPEHPLNLRWIHERNRLDLVCESDGREIPGSGVSIDLGTGHVTPLPDGAHHEVTPPVDLTRLVLRWQGSVGDHYKALVLEDAPDGQQMVLYGWNQATGLPLAPQKLIEGKRLIARASLDGHYLCLRNAMPSPDHPADRSGAYAWSIFDIASGKQIARMPFDLGTQAISILGPRAFLLVAGGVSGVLDQPFISLRQLKAVDLKTGKTIWERPVEGKRLVPVGQ